jgi:hypothetical protein
MKQYSVVDPLKAEMSVVLAEHEGIVRFNVGCLRAYCKLKKITLSELGQAMQEDPLEMLADLLMCAALRSINWQHLGNALEGVVNTYIDDLTLPEAMEIVTFIGQCISGNQIAAEVMQPEAAQTQQQEITGAPLFKVPSLPQD